MRTNVPRHDSSPRRSLRKSLRTRWIKSSRARPCAAVARILEPRVGSPRYVEYGRIADRRRLGRGQQLDRRGCAHFRRYGDYRRFVEPRDCRPPVESGRFRLGLTTDSTTTLEVINGSLTLGAGSLSTLGGPVDVDANAQLAIGAGEPDAARARRSPTTEQ